MTSKKGSGLMRHFRALACVFVAFLVASPTAFALVNYIALVQGERQGRIRGGITQKGREGAIQVLSIDHEIVSPRDPATGQATGKRQHKPIRVRMELDQSTPLLFQAMVTNETLTDVTLKGFTPSPTGAEIQHFTVQLTGATIAAIRMSAVTDASTEPEKALIEVDLVYQRIKWTWTDGGITAEDTWVDQN